MHGTQDKAAKPGGSQFFQDTAGSKDKTLKLYDGAFHDPLNDIGREQVTMDIVNWISPHLTRPSEVCHWPSAHAGTSVPTSGLKHIGSAGANRVFTASKPYHLATL